MNNCVQAEGRKQKYAEFCETTYVPIFSKPWWMDAVCEPQNWDVWLFEQGGIVAAAMPYYKERRGEYSYITKAPLTQNNGIIFRHDPQAGFVARQKFEQKVINEVCAFIEAAGFDVYEQQYHYSFEDWSPFFWQGYSALPRYTFVIEDTSSIDSVRSGVSSKQRAVIKKGRRSASVCAAFDPEEFYDAHQTIFARQGIPCPFSKELFLKLWDACHAQEAAQALVAKKPGGNGEIASVLYLVWDERSVYQLLGGNIPEFQSLDTFASLVWSGFELAHRKGLQYDFEGSMIERIARSFREYGGTPKLYFRIRKVFNKNVLQKEHEAALKFVQ